MAKSVSIEISRMRLVLDLDENEARWLKAFVQNPPDEKDLVCQEVCRIIFEGIDFVYKG